MKNLNLLLCIYSISILLLFSSESLGQELISNFNHEGSSQRQLLKEYNGNKYIIVINDFDSLLVYSYVNDQTLFLHGNHFPGISTESFLKTTNQFILYESIEGSLAYNFIHNEEIRFPYNNNQNTTNWSHINEDEVVLLQSSSSKGQNSQKIVNLISLEEESIEPILTILALKDNFLLLRETQFLDTDQWLIKDRESGATELITEGQNIQHYFDNDMFVYHKDNMLLSRDNRTGVNDTILIYNENATIYNIYDSENFIITSYELDSEVFLVAIEKETMAFKITDSNQYIKNVSYAESNQKIIIQSGSSAKIYDFTSNTIDFINNQLDDDFLQIIGGKYIFHAGNNEYRLLDLQENIYYDLEHSYQSSSLYSFSFFQENEKLIINLDHKIDQFKDLWEIDLSSMEMKSQQGIIPNMKNGLYDNSELIQLDENIFLIDEHIYKIKNNTITQINQGSLVVADGRKYKVIDDNFYWVENIDESIIICEYLNDDRNEIFTYPQELPFSDFQTIKDFSVTSQYIYFVDEILSFNKKLIQFNRANGEEKFIGEVSNYPYRFLYTHNESTYITLDKNYYATTDGLLIDLELPEYYDLNMEVLGQDLYFITNRNLLKINGSNVEITYEVGEFIFGAFQKWGDYLIVNEFGDWSNTLYSKDGENWNKIPVEEGQVTRLINDSYVYIYDKQVQPFESIKFINVSTGVETFIPEQYTEFNFYETFKHQNRIFLLANSTNFSSTLVHLFELKSDDNSLIKITDYETNRIQAQSNSVQDLNKSILYSGNRIFFINEDVQLEDLSQNIYGDSKADIVSDENYFYFIALDPSIGRQIYSVKNKSSVGSSDYNFPVEDIQVYPNPTNSAIRYEYDFKSNIKYSIIDSKGQIISNGLVGESIDVSRLTSGMYTLKLESNDGYHSVSKFIKI